MGLSVGFLLLAVAVLIGLKSARFIVVMACCSMKYSARMPVLFESYFSYEKVCLQGVLSGAFSRLSFADALATASARIW